MSKHRMRLSGFARDEAGSIGILFALIAIPIFGIIGLAIDYGRAINERSKMQMAADAAALAAASNPSLVEQDRITLAQEMFRQSHPGSATASNLTAEPQRSIVSQDRATSARLERDEDRHSDTLAITSDRDTLTSNVSTLAKGASSQNRTRKSAPPKADAINIVTTVEQGGDSSNGIVTVKAVKALNTTFAGVLGVSTLAIEVEAKAEVGVAGGAAQPACLLALEASDYGVKINGGSRGSHVSANCGVHVNSQSSRAIFGNSKGSITSAHTCVHGDFDRSPTYSPTPVNGCPRVDDPLAGVLRVPLMGECTAKNAKVSSGQSKTFTPGVYCGGIDIGQDAAAVFDPGTYVIRDGSFKIGAQATVSGDGVFFYLVGSNSRLLWGPRSEVEFKAPRSGDYKGMLVWSAEAHSNAHEISCHDQSVIEGAVYSPETDVQIGASGDVGASADWTIWVVKSIEVGSSAHLHISANYTNSKTPLPDGLLSRLTAQPKRAVLK